MLLRDEINPDEGQFLASAFKLFYDPNFFHAVDCHTSGPGNIYPLMWPAIFGLSPDFASTRIVGLITIFLSVYLLYRTVALVTEESFARIAILPVGLAFPVFANPELVFYSSEHVPVLLVSFALFLSARIFVRPDAYRQPAFLLGLTAGAAFLTKMQSLPIIAAAVLVSLLCIYGSNDHLKTWRAALLLSAGATLPLLFNTALCLKAGVLHDFWQSYLVANFDYTNPNVGLEASIRGFWQYVAEPLEIRSFAFAVLVITLASIAQRTREALKQRGSKSVQRGGALEHDPVRWLGLLALLSSGAAFFSVYKPHRAFIHYLLFLFIPVGLTMAWMLIRLAPRVKTVPYLAVAVTLGVCLHGWSFHDRDQFNSADMIRAPEGDFIRSVTSPGSQIFVWGWTARPYLASGRAPATRDTLVGNLFRGYNVMTSPPVYEPTRSSERVSEFYQSRELRDLKAKPPDLFIDATGPSSWFLSSRQDFGFERIPDIAAFVDAQYVHLADLYSQRYFLRRDLAAKREVEFNRPLPPRACGRGSVRCMDVPVTLPRELPSVEMPAHARIDVEFMPIRPQIGAATVFNNEAQPNSFRGLRLQHVAADRYILLVGLEDHWAVSREFDLPQGRIALVTIELDRNNLRIQNNGSFIDDLFLARPVADSPGQITIGSWIGGMDPFSGKIQFFEITDLDK